LLWWGTRTNILQFLSAVPTIGGLPAARMARMLRALQQPLQGAVDTAGEVRAVANLTAIMVAALGNLPGSGLAGLAVASAMANELQRVDTAKLPFQPQ
jgi:phosphate/sulfate permease